MTADPARTLFHWSIGVFLIGGFLTAFVGLLVPRMTLVLSLDHQHALLVSFAFYSSYLIFALPVAAIILRVRSGSGRPPTTGSPPIARHAGSGDP